jgi:hypothetical protein
MPAVSSIIDASSDYTANRVQFFLAQLSSALGRLKAEMSVQENLNESFQDTMTYLESYIQSSGGAEWLGTITTDQVLQMTGRASSEYEENDKAIPAIAYVPGYSHFRSAQERLLQAMNGQDPQEKLMRLFLSDNDGTGGQEGRKMNSYTTLPS